MAGQYRNNKDYTYISFSNDSNLIVINSTNEIFITKFENGMPLKSVKSQLEQIDDIDYNPDEKSLFLRQTVKNEIQISLDGESNIYFGENLVKRIQNTYIHDNKYEIIDIEKMDSKVINAGLMSTISRNSRLKFSIEINEKEIKEYSDKALESGSIFRIIDMKTNKNLKESYNASLKMTYSINPSLSEENDNSTIYPPPAVVFSKDSKSVYISDYSGKLLLWNWSKEPSLESKTKREKWGKDHWRISIAKTMLESKYINENIFECYNMNLAGVTGLSKEKIQSLKRSGAIIPTIFDDSTKNIKKNLPTK